MLLALVNCYQRTIDVEMIFVWCLLVGNVQLAAYDQVQVEKTKLLFYMQIEVFKSRCLLNFTTDNVRVHFMLHYYPYRIFKHH